MQSYGISGICYLDLIYNVCNIQFCWSLSRDNNNSCRRARTYSSEPSITTNHSKIRRDMTKNDKQLSKMIKMYIFMYMLVCIYFSR